MKRKDYKLLVEGWRKIISESFDDDDEQINITGDSLSLDSMTSNEDLMSQPNDIEATTRIEDNEDEIKRFCRLMGIDCDSLKDFLLTQSFEGDLEGNQFDEFGNEIDFDELDEQ